MLVDFAPGVAILDRNGRSAVLPQLFLRLFMAGWLYEYSSFLFGGARLPNSN